MESIVFLYRDPLFGVAILIGIIATIALLDYSHNKYKAQKKSQSLKDLAKSYEHTTLNQDIVKFVQVSPKALPSLMLIAKAHSQSGDSQMAINIYLSLLETTKNSKEKINILEALGNTYLDAGFLQRAKDIFTQILKTYPRNENIMSSLMQTYENMGEYQKALEALDCLDEIQTQDKQKFTNNKNYFYLMILLNTHIISIEKKIKSITTIGENNPLFHKSILRFLKTYDLKAFWDYIFSIPFSKNFIDILWELQFQDIPKNIESYPQIFEVFVAKGFFDSQISFQIFELEILYLFRKHTKKEACLGFEYRCHQCKSIFPFDSLRCPSCKELSEMDLILKPLEKPL
ncbi:MULTISPECIES: tetratricopeptide repeat protein [unclassified Helicobacter]|uniref:tetratricopeptide repeat protein n=1 Tax=unclassified Helicobacter TaxID=2593540 RepID=UPI000CF16E24|nr:MULTISPECIES: tetratricopeptide repeat protein [unclassified Helicobacter]